MPPKPEEQATKYGSLPRHYEYEHLEVTGGDPSGFISRRSAKRFLFVGAVIVAVVLPTMALRNMFQEAPAQKADIPEDHASKTFQVISPLSTKSPEDMGFPSTERSGDTMPGAAWGLQLLKDSNGNTKPLPTNTWYLNLLSQTAGEYSTESNKVYTVPYILDTVGPLTGLRVHWPVLQASSNNMQMVYDAANGLTMGTMAKISKNYVLENQELSPLGLSLKWGDKKSSMETHIVRGMPYATMKYSGLAPSFVGGNAPANQPLVDGKHSLECGEILGNGKFSKSQIMSAQREVQLHFKNSDFTWVVFFSRPVKLQCSVAPKAGPGVISDVMFQLNVVDFDNESPLIVRAALIDPCTTGKSDIARHCRKENQMKDKVGYLDTLRASWNLFPKTPSVDFKFPSDQRKVIESPIKFDWDVHRVNEESEIVPMEGGLSKNEGEPELLMFALPHHQAVLSENASSTISDYCIPTFHGNTCVVKGSQWALNEEVGSPQSFIAKRPPEASAIPALAEAIAQDIKRGPSDNLYRGAADTYFSGKYLARIARVLLIASELKELATASDHVIGNYDEAGDGYESSIEAAQEATLPSDDEITEALENLKEAVEVWLNGKAEATYVYDKTWGGLVNCGCDYEGKGAQGVCNNTFPDCPALNDVNVDFGNGYYNDHHFHYGYHTYAAAVVAKYDPEWGMKFFDRVMLYIRDIANPSPSDPFFPQFRHKDWFLGSSWASGIVSANTPHGRNQESSSEAIAAYEAVALFGDAMVDAFRDADDMKGLKAAQLIRDAGELLAATETKAANRYWHVWNSTTHVNTYPPEYTQPVVGMLYETMASFQTWFAPEAFVSYGIQLLPFTPAAEDRDDPEWASILYPKYDESCSAEHTFCVKNGWSIMLCGLRATAGDRKEALKMALEIPDHVFETEGGEGHSLTNTLWYIATRRDADFAQVVDTDATNSTLSPDDETASGVNADRETPAE